MKCAIRNIIFRGHNNVRLTKFSGKDWIETDERLFESVFECLREFVEDQKSWMHIVFEPNRKKTLSYWKMRWLPNRFRRKLSRKLALAHLDWEINHPDCGDVNEEGTQSNSAKQIKELYLWYVDEYPNRVDPYDSVKSPRKDDDPLFEPCEVDETGKIKYYKMISGSGPEWDEYYRQLDEAFVEENRLYEEATNKAIQVLKLRSSLWT